MWRISEDFPGRKRWKGWRREIGWGDEGDREGGRVMVMNASNARLCIHCHSPHFANRSECRSAHARRVGGGGANAFLKTGTRPSPLKS